MSKTNYIHVDPQVLDRDLFLMTIVAKQVSETPGLEYSYDVELFDRDGSTRATFELTQPTCRANAMDKFIACVTKALPGYGWSRGGMPLNWNGSYLEDFTELLFTWAKGAALVFGADLGEGSGDRGSVKRMMKEYWLSRGQRDGLVSPGHKGIELTPFGRAPGVPLSDGVLVLKDDGTYAKADHSIKHLNSTRQDATYAEVMKALDDILKGRPAGIYFQQYLDSSLANPDVRDIMQQWAGLTLTRHIAPDLLRVEKFMLIYGDAGTGKSIFLRILEKLLKTGWVSMSLSEINMTTLSIAEGKVALLGYDEDNIHKQATGVLKKMTSSEPMLANPKYTPPFQLTTTFMCTFCANQPPHFDEKSEAIAERLVAVRLTKTFRNTEKEIISLDSKIVHHDLAYVIAWAILGARKVFANGGKLKVPSSINIDSVRVAHEGHSIESFKSDLLEFGEGFALTRAEMWEVYVRYTKMYGHKQMAKKMFQQELLRSGSRDFSGLCLLSERQMVQSTPGATYARQTWDPERTGAKTPVLKKLGVKEDLWYGVRVRAGTDLSPDAIGVSALVRDSRGKASFHDADKAVSDPETAQEMATAIEWVEKALN